MKAWLPSLALMLCASAALADPPATQRAAQLVQDQLLKPLKRSESKRSRFSRAAPVATERRVRIIDRTPIADARGKTFLRFEVDVRHDFDDDNPWTNAAITGCAYPQEREVFVANGDELVPAANLLGDDQAPNADACRPAAPLELAAAEPAP